MIQLGEYQIQAPAVCVSIIGDDLKSMEKNLEKALNQGADLVELRLDKLKDTSGWKNLIQEEIPTIVTVRSNEEGGYFEGKEEDRIGILLDAIDSEASCVDIELSTSKEKIKEVATEAESKNTSLILSFHNFKEVPPRQELIDKAEQMDETGCDFAKLIGFANDPQDSLKMLDFLIQVSEKIETPVISFAMGEKGEFTRIAAPLLGSPITYASVEEKAAPGQMDLEVVRQILEKFQE